MGALGYRDLAPDQMRGFGLNGKVFKGSHFC